DPSWSATTAALESRSAPIAVTLADGHVLLAGGAGSDGSKAAASSTAELFDPATKIWKAAAPMFAARVGAGAARMLDGRVLVGGGTSGISGSPTSGCLQTAEIYDPKTDTWKKADSMAAPRASIRPIVLSSGKVMVIGGDICGTTVLSTELYDPATDTWANGPK